MGYKGRVVLITDASHPAAKAVAERLEQDGMTVIKNYPRMDKKGPIDEGSKLFAFDTWSLRDMNKLLNIIVDNVGKINHLVHSDNVVFRSSIEDISEEDFKKALDYNTMSAFITTKVFAEHIAQNGGGSIVYLSTLHDEKPTGCAFAYSVSKGCVKMLCKEIALFYGRRGVRANVVQMDYIKEHQELFDSYISPFNYDAQTKVPLHRLAQPKDFAGITSFLLSEDASFINGASIRVDGGHLLYYFDR